MKQKGSQGEILALCGVFLTLVGVTERGEAPRGCLLTSCAREPPLTADRKMHVSSVRGLGDPSHTLTPAACRGPLVAAQGVQREQVGDSE